MIGEQVQNGLARQKPPAALEQRDPKGAVGKMIGERPRPTTQSDKLIVDGVQSAQRPSEIFSGHIHKIDVSYIAVKVSQRITYRAG
jgi:hypothetical protein